MTQLKNATFDLRRNSSVDLNRIVFESIPFEPTEKDKRITHLPYELISVFLLSQNNNNSVLNFYSFGKDQSIPIKNVEKSGKSLSYLLHGIRENQNIIRRELRMLSGEYISADGLPLPKSAIETLLKIYDIYYDKCKDRSKEKISLRDLIEKVNSYTYEKSSNGEEKVRILIHILLLSTVSISSHVYEGQKKDILSRANLFHIASDNVTNESEIIKLLSDKACEKIEANKKNGGNKTGRVMDVCRDIYIDFRASTFEKLAIKHNEIKNKKLKAKGQYFSYNLGFNNADARLCAVLDLLKPYSKELNSEGSAGKIVNDKTFSLDCIAELMGVSSQLSERKDRFYESIINAASVFGEIHLNKHNIRILFGKYCSVGDVGNEETTPVGDVGSTPDIQSEMSEESVGLVGNTPEEQSDLSVFSVELVGNEGSCLNESKIKPLLVDQTNIDHISNTSNEKDFEENSKNEVESYISQLSHAKKKSAKLAIKRMGFKNYADQISQTVGFLNFVNKETNDHAS